MALTSEKKSNTRFIVATSLFIASILASFLISFLSHQGATYWLAIRPIAKGAQIASSDLAHVKGELPRATEGYFTSSHNPIGSITLRTINDGELIHIGAVSDNPEDLTSESISIAIRNSDLPIDISLGEIVDLYQLHDVRNGEAAIDPKRIISGVFIRDISRRGSNFGSDVALTISLHRDDVAKVLAATSSGRIVVVSTRG